MALKNLEKRHEKEKQSDVALLRLLDSLLISANAKMSPEVAPK